MAIDFQQLFESLPGLYIVLDPDLRVIAVSNAYLQTLVTQKDLLLGKNIHELYSSQNARNVPDNLLFSLHETKISKRPTYVEPGVYHIGNNATHATYRWSIINTPVLDEHGQVKYIMLQHIDGGKQTSRDDRHKIEDQHLTEEALKLSEKKFRLLVESLPIGVWLLDEKGNIHYRNRAARHIWAGERFVGPVDFDQYRAWWPNGKIVENHEWAPVKVLSTRKKVVGDILKIQRFNEEFATIVNSAFPLIDDNGDILGVLVTNQDITEEKRLEKDREELMKKIEEERLWIEAVVETAPVGILLLKGKHGENVVANRQLKNIVGPEVDWGRGIHAILGIIAEPDTCTPVPFEDLSALRALTGETITGKEEMLCLSKGNIPVLANSGAITNAEGEVIGAVTIYQDISHLKKISHERETALQELDKEKRWLQALFEDAPIPVIIIRAENPQFPIPNKVARKTPEIDWKKGQEAYLGYVFDVKGKALKREQLPSARILRGETIAGEEYLIRFANNREIPFLVSGGIIEDENGKRIGGVLFYQDISRMKEAERFREEWSAVIAHDLRQPITTIQLAVDLLKSPHGDRDQVKVIAKMLESSTKQINRMTHDLLQVSQLEANKLKLERRETELIKLLRQIVEKYQYLTPDRVIKLESSISSTVVKIDRGRFEQIMGNLLSNAIKYSYHNSEIKVEVFNTQKCLQISVTNKGMGLEAHDLEKLFQRFHRSNQAKKRGIKGTGLGLYITKGLVEAHGGEIYAESEPGQLTTFNIKLPHTLIVQK